MAQANVRVKSYNFAVSFELLETGVLGDCFYCGEPGAQIIDLSIQSVKLEDVQLVQGSREFGMAVSSLRARLNLERFIHTDLLGSESHCQKTWRDEISAQKARPANVLW